ncbi:MULTISPECIES: HEAT repeat domain-containing protein [unclassified Microcoleus]|uniref:HEAT repeat domain-containing protein n=1 Tax=unclassified Microcoleus TaxID=2642155 RepID=UPI0025DCE762|nr:MULTISPECIES: HEAT repeat domain-containing protein [unclassified Microcoleus]
MTKHYRQRLVAVIALSFLSFTSPLLLTRNAAAQNLSASKANPKEIDSLIEKLKTNDERELDATIKKLRKIGKPAIPALIEALRDQNLLVRRSAAEVLQRFGASAIPALVKASKDSDVLVRRRAAVLLAKSLLVSEINRSPLFSSEAKAVVPQLVLLLKDSDPDVRISAVYALGNIGGEAKTVIPQLIPLLQDSDASVRSSAASTLGLIGKEAKAVVPQLVPLLQDSDTSVRTSAAYALGNIGGEAKTVIPQLVLLLKDSDASVRGSAAYALGFISEEAKTVIPQLVLLLKDFDASVRGSAAYALGRIALRLQEKAKMLTSPELNEVVSNLESALKILAEPKGGVSPQTTIANLRVYINVLKAEQNDRLFVKSIIQNPYIWGTGIYLFLLFGTFAIRPLWLLKIYETLKPIGFKIPVLGTDVSLGNLIFFKYHPRVLDAWVTAHIQAPRNEFQKRETVRDRKIFVPIPVILDNNTIATLKGKDLQPTFAQKRGCLLIWEEGGAGKTSLACQIGKWAMSDNPEERICSHRMLPVLIEEELNIKVTEGKQPFIEAIRGQLQDLTDTAEPISEELLQQLLKQRRILVIVDHFSEMSEQTRTAIKPGMPDFSVNALLVTSRLQEDLDKVTKTTIKPLRIAGNRLSSFMESYLSQRQKRDLFSSDTEFFDACIQLSTIAGDRNITVLLAKLYADQLIAKKEGTTDGNLPDNIAELMLHYLNQVNHSVTEDKISDSTVQKDAKIIAWECLKSTYRPAAANPKNAIIALGAENPESRIKYLEEKLRIIQTKGVAHDQIHFALDPVAEYLAALHLLDINGTDESKWQDFLNIADSQNSPEGIKGFMLAVKDCYLDEISGAKDTDFLPQQITSRYNVTITAVPVSP